ncbi:MAG TPA: hypothetical protein VM221_01545 [Armatimonadota bacterium]|nr:hypothetical protein [Armatimonadota bacterium]
MPSHFTLRMQFGLHQDAAVVAEQLRRLLREAPVEEIMFFYFAEELNDGHDRGERIRQWIEHSRPYRRAVAEMGAAVSLNPWHSVLHCDRGRTLKPDQPWQPMVDQHGRACQAVVCPLDPEWRRYYDESLRLYAQEDFRVIWIDDDIRYHNHDPLEWGGCFCPLHVAEFNRRAGTQATREEIVANCTAPGPPHPWRERWMDMWDDLHVTMIAQWRETVEAGGSRLGLMSSRPESHAAEGRRWGKWWRALAGDRPPAHRPHFWGYGDVAGPALYTSIAVLQQNRSLQPDAVESGPEIECFPYGRWNKSFRQVGAQMALAHILGSTHLNLSLYDFMGNDPADEPERAEFLRRWRPLCDWLADQFPLSLRSVGVGVPWSPDMSRRLRTDGSGGWQSLTCPSRGWARWLGAAGQAFSVVASPAVNALGGPVAWSFSDDQLRAWLAQGLLLDGEAASILLARGLGDLIGVRGGRFIAHGEVLYSVEQCLDAEFSLRPGAQISVNAHDYARRLFQAELAPDARVVSDLRNPQQQVVGHGLAVYRNALGGRVAIVPWSAEGAVMMNPQRAAQLAKVMGYLDPGETRGWAEGGAWLAAQFLADSERWRGVIWNASPDAARVITVHPPQGMHFTTATQVTADGERIAARLQGARLTLEPPLHQWEFVALTE